MAGSHLGRPQKGSSQSTGDVSSSASGCRPEVGRYSRPMAKRRRNSARDYPRTARLNELLREIIAGVLDGIDDERLGWVSISGVEVDNELTRAKIYVSSLDDDPETAAAVLSEYRGRFRKAIGDQARMRKVPDLEFHSDPGIQAGSRVEQILARLEAEGSLGSTNDGPEPRESSRGSDDAPGVNPGEA